MQDNKENKFNFNVFKDQYLWYMIVFAVSFISLIFLPAVGTTVGLEWNIPDNATGWVVWIAVRVCVACINVLLFYSFMKQAEVNVRNDKRYIEATDILYELVDNGKKPRSPEEYFRRQWTTKGVFIFVMSLLATIALTQAVLSYDYVAFLTYLFTIIMGLILGIIQMKNTEMYYLNEYYKYAIMIKKEKEKENGNNS